jgi:hypothetical protein
MSTDLTASYSPAARLGCLLHAPSLAFCAPRRRARSTTASGCCLRLQEDEQLRALVAQHGPKAWARIAAALRTKGAKQCRRRWKNFFNMSAKTCSWSPEVRPGPSQSADSSTAWWFYVAAAGACCEQVVSSSPSCATCGWKPRQAAGGSTALGHLARKPNFLNLRQNRNIPALPLPRPVLACRRTPLCSMHTAAWATAGPRSARSLGTGGLPELPNWAASRRSAYAGR